MEQNNKNYIYTIIGIGLIVVIGLFFWNMQTAESPVETPNTDQQEQENGQNEGENGTERGGEGEENGDETTGEGDNQSGDSGANEQTGSEENTSGNTGGQTDTPDDPTAGWRTYKNNSLGLTFKFPQDWRLTENSQSGEYTLQAYAGTVDNKTTRVNILIHETEIDQQAEASAKTTVNEQEAYVYTNTCRTGSTCVMNRTVFTREGTVSGGVWTGNVVEITATTDQSETTTLRTNVTNLINSISLN